jgi:hypothetical protein
MEETFSMRSVPKQYNEDYAVVKVVQVRELTGSGTSAVASHYQATASED